MSKVITQEEKDQEELREVEGKIKEVLDLMASRHNRAKTDNDLSEARERRDEHHQNVSGAFYKGEGKSVPVETTMHTRAHLQLAGVLKTRIKLGQYAGDLEDSLRRLSERHVEVLERILSRSRY
jgi:hypothetical protein